jgi:tetratricopeptide (TPR) repeat protein
MFRRDLLSQSISFAYAVMSDVWHWKEHGAPVQVSADPDAMFQRVQHYLYSIQLDEVRGRRIMDKLASAPHLIQFYEDIVAASREEVLRFLRHLGIGCELAEFGALRLGINKKIAKVGDLEVYEDSIRRLPWLVPLLAARKQLNHASRETGPVPPCAAAAPVLRSAEPVAPEQIAARLNETVPLARAGQRLEARAAVAAAVAAFPGDRTILHTAGVVLRGCGDFQDALALFYRVLEICPGFYFTEKEIGGVMADLGRTEEALAWYHRAIRSAPHDAALYLLAARTEQAAGRLDRAAAVLASGATANPANREVRMTLAQELMALGRRDAAVAAYRMLLADGLAQPADHAEMFRLQSMAETV